jgi:ribosomal protein S6
LQQKVLLFATKDIFEKLHLSVSQWGKKELAYIIKLLEI